MGQAMDQEKGPVCHELCTERTDVDDAGSRNFIYSWTTNCL